MKTPAAYVRETMRPLGTQATGMRAKLPRLSGIGAVVFDLYGTLLISAAGCGSPSRPASPGDPDGLLDAVIRRHQDLRRAEGSEYPEVDIREVWREALAEAGKTDLPPEEIEWTAFRHECLTNPVWPMPDAAETLAALRGAGLLLGIVSNAQFYTLPVMEGLFDASLDGLGFHPGLRVFSFEEREGKPSPRLYQRLRDRAAALGIGPEEVLYLGNDFQKDVAPAKAAGFRAGLFAGDARSLRLGGVAPEEASEIADAVITGLAQIPGLLQIGG